jgi:hypothetical protein
MRRQHIQLCPHKWKTTFCVSHSQSNNVSTQYEQQPSNKKSLECESTKEKNRDEKDQIKWKNFHSRCSHEKYSRLLCVMMGGRGM